MLVIVAGFLVSRVPVHLNLTAPAEGAGDTVRVVLWAARHLDIVGQIIILLGGAFGVVVLLKEFKHE